MAPRIGGNMLNLGRLSSKYSGVKFVRQDEQGRLHHRALHDALTRSVSIVALPRLSEDGTQKHELMFRRGAKVAAALQHPRVIQVLDYEVTPTHHLLVTELIEGETLHDVLQREGRLPVDRAFQIVCELAEALEMAHAAGQIHRNLHPREIVITPSGSVKLGGFEAAYLPDQLEDSPCDSRWLGNVFYMAPEQAQNQPVTERADVYALGVLLYLMLTGQPPVTGSNAWAVLYRKISSESPGPSQWRAELSEEVDRFVGKLLKPSPEQRFDDMAEVRQAIANFYAAPQPETDAGTDRIVGRYPFPLATAYLLVAHEMGPSRQLNRLMDLFEATLKYSTSLALWRAVGGTSLQWSPEDANTLRRPALGHWARYMDLSMKAEAARPAALDGKLRGFYFDKHGDAGRGKDIIDAGLQLRNRLRHGATWHDSDYQSALDDFRPRVDTMLQALEFLGDYPLARTARLRFEQGQFVVSYWRCMGAIPVFATDETSLVEAVEDHCLGVIDPEERRFINLAPLLSWRPCQICGEEEIVYYNGMKGKGKLSFLNYQKGHVFDEPCADDPFQQLGVSA